MSTKTTGKKPFRIVYADSEAEGHHVALHARTVLKEAVQRGWQCVWLTSHQAVSHPASKQLISEMGHNLTLETASFQSLSAVTNKLGSGTLYEIRHYLLLGRSLRMLSRKYPVDVVYLAFMDHCARIIGAFGLPYGGLYYAGLHDHVALHERKQPHARIRSYNNAMIRRLYTRPHLARVGVLLEQFADFAKSTQLPGWEKVRYVPDLAYLKGVGNRNSSRNLLGAKNGDLVVLVYGALTARKSIQDLLKACGKLAEPRRFVILLAGRQDADVSEQIATERPSLEKAGIRLVEWNRFLNDEAEGSAFAAADMVWMGYREYLGSSGVLLQSAQAGLPVIACHEGTIGWTTRRHELGQTINPSDATGVSEAINKLAENPHLRKQCGERGIALAKKHTPEQFGAKICDLIMDSAA